MTREEYWEALGKDTPDDEPDVPESALYLIQWFLRLSSCRRGGFNGVEPITDLDIWAWQMNSGQRIKPEEVEILVSMDQAYRSAIAEKQKQENERGN